MSSSCAIKAEEIAEVNDSLARDRQKLRVLRSIELNLNPAGEGDMEPHALAQLDLVIGCFHSSLRLREDQTERYLAALHNPDIQILGHPRGRIYNYHAGLFADWRRVFAVAAELDKAIEINAYPDRQDFPELVVLARDAGCRISFGTDSHSPTQLRFIVFAAASALKAGIERSRIVNFMPREELLAWVQRVRERQNQESEQEEGKRVATSKRTMKTNPHILAVLFDHSDGVAMIDPELRAAVTGRNWILAQDFGRSIAVKS